MLWVDGLNLYRSVKNYPTQDIHVMSLALTVTHIRKTISLEITDEESYEKNLIMYVNIGEPRQIAGTLLIIC